MGPKASIWGQAWPCDLIDRGGQQQRQSVSLWKRVCSYVCNRVSVCERDLRRGVRLAGSREDVNVSLRWQQQHSRTQTCVWHEEGGDSISYHTIPPSSYFSCCAVQTLEPVLNSCWQALGGGMDRVCRCCAPGPCRRVPVFWKHATPLSSFFFSHFSSLVFLPLCFSLASGLWLNETNKSMWTCTFIQISLCSP